MASTSIAGAVAVGRQAYQSHASGQGWGEAVGAAMGGALGPAGAYVGDRVGAAIDALEGWVSDAEQRARRDGAILFEGPGQQSAITNWADTINAQLEGLLPADTAGRATFAAAANAYLQTLWGSWGGPGWFDQTGRYLDPKPGEPNHYTTDPGRVGKLSVAFIDQLEQSPHPAAAIRKADGGLPAALAAGAAASGVSVGGSTSGGSGGSSVIVPLVAVGTGAALITAAVHYGGFGAMFKALIRTMKKL